jgi:hypothetical protein
MREVLRIIWNPFRRRCTDYDNSITAVSLAGLWLASQKLGGKAIEANRYSPLADRRRRA